MLKFGTSNFERGFSVDTLDEEPLCAECAPERSLMRAIVSRAVSDLTTVTDSKIREDAKRWLTVTELEDPEVYSFQYICMILQIDYSLAQVYVKKLLFRG